MVLLLPRFRAWSRRFLRNRSRRAEPGGGRLRFGLRRAKLPRRDLRLAHRLLYRAQLLRYSYLDHLDRVRDDPNYCFGLSEVSNLMAILEFEPERFAELRRRIQEGRVELLNGFFLEPTINLSGGKALVKMGVEGLRWQQHVMGVRPRCTG